MRATTPQTIDGEVYDHLSINLAITYRVLDADNGDASVAMRIVPTRIDADGAVVTADDAAMGKFIGSLSEADADATAAAQAVFNAVKAYLVSQGI
jgi:hypothetical protein